MTTQEPNEQPPIQCFLSYAHADDQVLGFVDRFKTDLRQITRADSGRELQIFVDRDDIGWGDEWQERLRTSVRNALVFIPLATAQYLTRPKCREELLLFVENAIQLGITDLFLPTVVLGHRHFKEDSDDPVARHIARYQYKNLREAVIDGPDSATWRRTMVNLSEALITAVENAENKLQFTEAATNSATTSGPPPDAGPAAEGLDDDAPALDELSDRMEQGAEEIGGLLRALTDSMVEFEQASQITKQLKGASNEQGRTTVLRFAAAVREPALRAEKAGREIEEKAAEMDSLLRSAWSLVKQYGTDEMKTGLRSSIEAGTATLDELEDVEATLTPMLHEMKALEVLSVPLRKSIRPLRIGLTSTTAAMRTIKSWESFFDAEDNSES